ncbi:hypothetical protein LCGC14_2449830 [marine sediment metagenome]|uniref:Uncharacterized protein n=1 Tax=marine sediment metagenome TaxID=412755 RepID=A0A0F9DTJ1_9ZZZZ
MAITQAALTEAANTTDATSFTTASITPTANRLVLVAVHAGTSTGDSPANTPTISGNGLTYVQIATIGVNDTGGGNLKQTLTLFRAMGASPSTGVITIDFAGETQVGCIWGVDEFAGIDTGGVDGADAVVQSATNSDDTASVNSLTVTLAAFGDAGNATYGTFGIARNQAFTEGTGFTEISDLGHGTPNRRLQTEWRDDNDTSVDVSWTDAADCFGIAAEIKAAAGAVTRRIFVTTG